MSKNFAIFSPVAGLKQDEPSITLKDAASADLLDVYFRDGEVKRYNKRQKLWDYQFDDIVLKQYTFRQASKDRQYALYFTRRDVLYKTETNFVYINKSFTGGLIVDSLQLEPDEFSLELDLETVYSLSVEVKAGDFIRLSDSTSTATTDDVWYEITQVVDATHINCSGVLPSGYSAGLGDAFYIRKIFAGTDDNYWHVDAFNEKMIATNDADFPIGWEGQEAEAYDITSDFKCKSIVAFGNRVVAINVTATGTNFPINIRWSDFNTVNVWEGIDTDAGEAAYIEGDGFLVHGIVYRDFLYLFKSESIRRVWAVASDDVFESKVIRNDLGTKAGHSVVVYRDVVYFYCTQDNTIRRFDGFYDQIISKDIAPFMRDISKQRERYIQGFVNRRDKLLMFAVPYATDIGNNRVLVYDVEGKTGFAIIDMAVSSFGVYELVESYEWATLPFDEWLSWNWDSWLSSEGESEAIFDMVAGYSRYVYQVSASRQDDGQDYTGYIVLETDLQSQRALPFFKRMHKIQFYMTDNGAGTVQIEIKRDDESTWQNAGSITLSNNNNLRAVNFPVDYRARSFKIKISSEYYFSLVGLVFWYTPQGGR